MEDFCRGIRSLELRQSSSGTDEDYAESLMELEMEFDDTTRLTIASKLVNDSVSNPMPGTLRSPKV